MLRVKKVLKHEIKQQLTIIPTMISDQQELEGFILHLTIKRVAAVPCSNQV